MSFAIDAKLSLIFVGAMIAIVAVMYPIMRAGGNSDIYYLRHYQRHDKLEYRLCQLTGGTQRYMQLKML